LRTHEKDRLRVLYLKEKATGIGGMRGGFFGSSEFPGMEMRINLSIAAKPKQSSPQIREVFPLHKERGEKRSFPPICKAMQVSAACGMSLRSLHQDPNPGFAALLDLKGRHISFCRHFQGATKI
jgi:hypothetical protein